MRTRIRTLLSTFLGASSAQTPGALRAAAVAFGAGEDAPLPENLRPWAELVRSHAYRITDEDLNRLREDGYSEDEIYEITCGLALGAAKRRYERGLAALGGT